MPNYDNGAIQMRAVAASLAAAAEALAQAADDLQNMCDRVEQLEAQVEHLNIEAGVNRQFRQDLVSVLQKYNT